MFSPTAQSLQRHICQAERIFAVPQIRSNHACFLFGSSALLHYFRSVISATSTTIVSRSTNSCLITIIELNCRKLRTQHGYASSDVSYSPSDADVLAGGSESASPTKFSQAATGTLKDYSPGKVTSFQLHRGFSVVTLCKETV